MSLVIVPNDLRDAIYKKVDAALELVPTLKGERENIYKHLLAIYDETGKIPDFKIEPVKENLNEQP